MPLVSVILPVYNGEKYIHEAVMSVLNQTFKDFTLFVLDDGSTDATIEQLETIDDSRMIIHRNITNKGLIYTLNKGLDLSKDYKYIARMDADDISLEDRFEKQINFLERNPKIGLIGSAMQQFGSDKSDNKKIYRPDTAEKITSTFLFYNPISHPTVMMRSKVVFNEYSYDFPKYEDYHLWIELYSKTKFHNLKDILVKYRRHNTNVTSTYQEDIESDHDYIKKLIKLFCDYSSLNLTEEEINVISIISSKVRYSLNNNFDVQYLFKVKNDILSKLNHLFDKEYFNYLFLERLFSYFLFFKKYDCAIETFIKMSFYGKKKLVYSILNLNKN
ncbi:hypothetical protein BWI96_12135 [Siphonobacter sp. SORGH_AS_0500]|uniref:glycosyltransferase n=1 Tax=Siphonobacter sp. SORGH_AS_0500 TaxID=1864824 RepID=UPI000CBFC5A7|nr:glycosyltransferase [Siphonobacter sp. SORGH_AS_0500]PKK36159.1 hypothetical protein BWI96_12135 [Siphonobacter sp. SORGH_AS_0500]